MERVHKRSQSTSAIPSISSLFKQRPNSTSNAFPSTAVAIPVSPVKTRQRTISIGGLFKMKKNELGESVNIIPNWQLHSLNSSDLSQIWGEFAHITGTNSPSIPLTSPIRKTQPTNSHNSPSLLLSIHPGSPASSTYTPPPPITSNSTNSNDPFLPHSSSLFSLSSFPSPPLSQGEFFGSTVSILPPSRLSSLEKRSKGGSMLGTRPLSMYSDEEDSIESYSPKKKGLVGLNLFEITEEPRLVITDSYHDQPIFSPYLAGRKGTASPSFPSNSSTFSVDVSSPTPSYPSTSSQPSSLFTVSSGSSGSNGSVASSFDEEVLQLCNSYSSAGSSFESDFLRVDRSPLFGLEYNTDSEDEENDLTIKIEEKGAMIEPVGELGIVREDAQIEYGWAI